MFFINNFVNLTFISTVSLILVLVCHLMQTLVVYRPSVFSIPSPSPGFINLILQATYIDSGVMLAFRISGAVK
jgi:hypothetical protein